MAVNRNRAALSITLSKGTHERLNELAALMGVTRSEAIEQLVGNARIGVVRCELLPDMDFRRVNAKAVQA